MSEETMPRERVYVVQLKPWEAMLVLPGEEEGEPIKATMDRRKDEFTIRVMGDRVEIEGGGSWETLSEGEPPQMRCPGCAGANLGWRARRDGVAVLTCNHCRYEIIEAQLGTIMASLPSELVYDLPSETWGWA